MSATTPMGAPKPHPSKGLPGVQQYTALGVLTFSAILLVLMFGILSQLSDQSKFWERIRFVSGCALCPTAILLAIKHGYLFGRWCSWLMRRRGERVRANALKIPGGVRTPDTFEGVAPIDAAEKEALPSIPDAQGRYRARALTIYAAPAVAVLLAGMQVAGWPNGSFGSGLVLGQAFLVFFVFLRVIIDRQPTQDWIERRTRAELLRREQYLCLGRVGPYSSSRPATVAGRIAQIQIASSERMSELLVMEDEDDKDRATWMDQLASQFARPPIFDDLGDRLATFQYYRASKQIAWMRSTLKDIEGTAKRIQWFVGIVAVATILIAAINSFALVTSAGYPSGGASGVSLLRGLVGLGAFLPALGGMLLALQSVFNLRFLAANYRLTERSLERLHRALIELQDEVGVTWKNADASRRRGLEMRFQKLVLRIEAELTAEYLRWRMITQRDAHEL
jgi:hypothetical protein